MSFSSAPADRTAPCGLFASGHTARPFRHWRKMPAMDFHVVEHMESDEPDTLIIVIGRTEDLVNFPDTPVERRVLRYCTHAADELLEDFRKAPSGTSFDRPRLELNPPSRDGYMRRYPLADPYRYQRCHELMPDPRDPEQALELPYLKEREQISREITWATPVRLAWRDDGPHLEPRDER
jgi:hypothetical protein